MEWLFRGLIYVNECEIFTRIVITPFISNVFAKYMKRLLMLGGGFLQSYVINRAKELGYNVLVLDADPNAVGFKLSDEHAVINIVDENACLHYALDKKVDGVLTAATDFGVLTMSHIADAMHLPGINYQTAKIIKNKASVRKCLFDSLADDTGYSFEIKSLDEAPALSAKIEYPVMVKPVDGSGSRGASKVNCIDDFVRACELAMAGSISHHAVAEPFVVGKEYGVETFVDNGVIHVLGVMQKDMTDPPYYAELGHAMPSGLSEEMENKVKACVKRAILALNVNHGSVNMDIIIGDKGDVHIVDIGARMGGNLIGSHIIPQGTGIAYVDNMIRAAVGDKTDFTPVAEPQPVATKLLALTPGRVAKLPDFKWIAKECDVQIEHHLHVGDIITPYRTNLDGCGYVIATGKTVDEAVERVKRGRDMINEQIERS